MQILSNMSYNIWLWSMAFLLYLLDTPICVVRGLIIDAVPGQNVSLPCMVDQVNYQQTVKWWAHNGYISSGKIIDDLLGTTKEFYALPGADADYTLFIMIPDDINTWPYLADTYKCRLVPGNNGNVQELQIYELQIYQPECTIIHINGSTSVASCSYENIPGFEATLSNIDISVSGTEHCTSDACTLNYTYTGNPNEINPQDLECSVKISDKETGKTQCSSHRPSTTLPQKTNVSSRLTYPTSHTATENSQGTATTSINGGSPSKMTTTSPEASTSMTTTISEGTIVISSTTMTTIPEGIVLSSTTMTSTIPEGNIISSTMSTNPDGTATIMTTAYPEEIATSLTKSITTEETYLIVISVAASIILVFLIIFIISRMRRRFKEKQNSSKNSSPTDENVYFEIDEKDHKKAIGMMERPAQNKDINFEQSPVDSAMEENYIYQSADTNAYEQDGIINKDNVAMSHKEKIQPGYLDQNKAYEEIDDIIDDININKNKKSDGPTTSQTHNKVETSDDLGYIENENEAYQSLDDEFNENMGNAGREASERTQAMKQNVVKPAYVHYEVLERE